MGRKPLPPKAEEKASPFDGGNSTLSGEGQRAGATRLFLDLPEKMPENGNVAYDGMELPSDSVNPPDSTVGSHNKRKSKSTVDSSKVKTKRPKTPSRRSGRLQSIFSPARNTYIGPVIEDITKGVGEEEEVVPQALEEIQLEDHKLSGNNLEEKVFLLSEVVEQLKTRLEDLTSKFEKSEEAWSQGNPEAETNTVNVHEECLEKIEALKYENRELCRKLENIYTMYSKGNCLFAELFEKVKDIMLLFGLKAADMAPSAPHGTDPLRGRGPVNGMD